MSQSCRPLGLATCLVLLSLLPVPGCSSPTGMRSDDSATPSDQHPVPFHDAENGSASASGSVTSSSRPTNGRKAEAGVPFRDSQSLPAGTLLTVRLRNPISADNPGPSSTFEAVVDEPVVIEGDALVPLGASVAGRVEAAHVSKVKGNRAYLRLTLESIDFAGKDLPVQTSSLFARGTAPDGDASATVITLEKGRRLTFRLAEPVFLANQEALNRH